MPERTNSARSVSPAPLGVGLEFLRALAARGIAHCHWKSNEHLAEALAGETDLDLLVDAAQREPVRELLRALGWKAFESQPWASYPGIEDWFGLDRNTGRLFHVHLHFEVWSGTRYVKPWRLPFEARILASARPDPELEAHVTEPALELALLGLRIGIKTPFTALLFGAREAVVVEGGLARERAFLAARVSRDEVEKRARELVGDSDGPRLAELVYGEGALQRGGVRALRALARRHLSVYRRAGALGTAALFAQGLALHVYGKLGRRLGLHPRHRKRAREGGVVVALTGSDGAGKSTLLAELVRWASWQFEVESLYLGSGVGSTGVNPRLRRALKRGEDGAAAALRRLVRPLRDYLHAWFALALVRERRAKLERAHALAERGWLVLCDRFPQNQVPGTYDGPTIGARAGDSRWLAALGRRESRAHAEFARSGPDLVIRLSVPVEVALARKPDHSPEILRRNVELTRTLDFGAARVLDLDASLPAAEVARLAKQGIWECL